MSESKNVTVDAHNFALAVVQSTTVNGDSPESIAEQKLELYLAAVDKVIEHNKPILEAKRVLSNEEKRNRTELRRNLGI